jgi:hypothetical protein
MARRIYAAMGKDVARTIALIFVLGFPTVAAAHGGGLDAAGCHNDNKHGGYHCHRGSLAGRSFSSKAEALEAMGGDNSPRAPSGNMQRLLPEQPRSGAGYAAECPCGSGKVCVGPRGGRFCINASGNKRYGM